MAFLTLGGTPYLVEDSGAAEAEPEYAGQRGRAFAGNLRSSRRVTKRVWTFVLAPITETAYQTLRALILNDAIVVASGDAMNGANVTVMVDITASRYVRNGTAVLREPALTLNEV